MKHKNCGGEIVKVTASGDSGVMYQCTKCKRGYKCVGYEQYLRDIVE